MFGSMENTATPTVVAGVLGNRSLTMPKGVLFTCSLKTRVISATSGLVGCQVQTRTSSRTTARWCWPNAARTWTANTGWCRSAPA